MPLVDSVLIKSPLDHREGLHPGPQKCCFLVHKDPIFWSIERACFLVHSGPSSWSTEVLFPGPQKSWSTESLLPGSQRSCFLVHRKLIYFYMFTWQKLWGRDVQVSLTRTLIPHKRSPFSGPSYPPVPNASVWRLASNYEFWPTETGTAFILQHLCHIPW